MFDTTVMWTLEGQLDIAHTLIGPKATLNNKADTDFVGYLNDFSRSAEVRVTQDPKADRDGSIFGPFFYGPGSYTADIEIARASTSAATFARRDKLLYAMNAMTDDMKLSFTESGGVAKLIRARRQQYPTGPNAQAVMQFALTAKDPRVYSVAVHASAPAVNVGNAATDPVFTFTPSGGTVDITQAATTWAVYLRVGAGFLTSGVPVTVDFGARTVVQAGVPKPGAVIFPDSVWWQIPPDGFSNSWSIGNATSASIAYRDAWI